MSKKVFYLYETNIAEISVAIEFDSKESAESFFNKTDEISYSQNFKMFEGMPFKIKKNTILLKYKNQIKLLKNSDKK